MDSLADRDYDLYLLCDPATPFAQDELGMRTEGPHRARMNEAYLAHARETGMPFVVVTGSHSERMRQATSAVDALLRGGPAVAEGEHLVELANAEQAA